MLPSRVSLRWRRFVRAVLRHVGLDLRRLGRGAVLVAHDRLTRRGWLAVEKDLTAYAVAEHVAEVLRMYRVDCVLDVGANTGQYARRLRRGGYTGRIVSFEPVAEAYAELERAAAGDPAWTVHPFALGRVDGVASINVVPGTLSSVLPPTRFGARRYSRLRDPEAREVQMRRLDGLLDDVVEGAAARRLYLKLDTQGYDSEVFAGLGDRVQELIGMQAELALMTIYDGMPRLPAALADYEASGFEVTALYPVSRERRTARVLEFDCVMVRAGAL
jgi:FkbM family methyltransferase